jgi:short-subunit dehydrogenase
MRTYKRRFALSRTLVAITGASSGIGAAFARKLAPEHDLLLIARRKDRLQQLAIELSSAFPSRIEVMQADLTAEPDLAAVADKIRFEDRLGLLVNNAGFGTVGRFWQAPLDTQEAMHKLHVMATVRLTHAALRNMVPRDFGAIINVSSVSAFVRNAGSVSYGATKSWMTAFTEGLYLELQGLRSQVTVQALCPGFTYSEFHSTLGVERNQLAGSGFWMTAEQVVDASLDGLRKGKLFVIPGWRYRLLATFFTKIPTALRVAAELAFSRARAVRTRLPSQISKQLHGGE